MLSIEIFEYILLLIFFSIPSSFHQSLFQSTIHLTEFGRAFQPRNTIELLETFTNVRSLIQCSAKCNFNRQCRTFDYDQSSLICHLFEGEFSTGTVLTNSIPLSSRIGAILYDTPHVQQSYSSYNKTCDQCTFDENRYLQCRNNTCQCPFHTYWNGQMCLNQLYNGSNCSSSFLSCREDFNLTCSNQTQTCIIPSPPAWQTVAFKQPKVLYATNPGPISLVSADFNKDSHYDLAVTNYYANNISIFFGIGNGSFEQTPISFNNSGLHPYWMITADFNADQNADLAVCNEGSNTVSILLGQGNGSFKIPAITFSSGGSGPSSLIAADLNNDNKTDLVVTNTISWSITTFLGLGNGTFQLPGTSYSAAQGPAFITKGHFNADGYIDLAVVSRVSNQFIIFFGFGNGTFQTNYISYTTGLNPYSIDVADLNADSKLDLVIGNYDSHTISIFMGTNNGTFVVPSPATHSQGIAGPFHVVIQDLNADSKMDLVVCSSSASNITLYMGNGDGTFVYQNTLATMGSGQSPTSAVVQDFNQDGKYDLAAANFGDNTLAILLQ